MPIDQPRVRQNYPAILVAAIACFLLEAGWYSYFLNPWLEGIGRTRESLMSQGVNPALQYCLRCSSPSLSPALRRSPARKPHCAA